MTEQLSTHIHMKTLPWALWKVDGGEESEAENPLRRFFLERPSDQQATLNSNHWEFLMYSAL